MRALIVIYLLTILFAFIAGMRNYRHLSVAEQRFVPLLGITVLVELIAFGMAISHTNNMALYQMFSLLSYFLIIRYFYYALDSFLSRTNFLILLLFGISAFTLNLLLLQPLEVFNSHFFMVMSVVIICLGLFTFFRLLTTKNGGRLSNSRRFWMNAILVMFWSITFLHWGLYNVLDQLLGLHLWLVHVFLVLINIATYTGFGIVLASKRLDRVG